MATYIYETIPSKPGEYPEQFEFQQSMNDRPLTKHPKTGQPVRRLISGGLGIIGTARDSGPIGLFRARMWIRILRLRALDRVNHRPHHRFLHFGHRLGNGLANQIHLGYLGDPPAMLQ